MAPFAAKVVRMGPVGAGHAMKAVNNALLAVNILGLAEGLVTLAKAGLEPRAMLDVLNASSGRSFVSEVLIPERVLTGSVAAALPAGAAGEGHRHRPRPGAASWACRTR